jgi:hypothetical protein
MAAPSDVFKSHELKIYNQVNDSLLQVRDSYQQEPGQEYNTVNRSFRMEVNKRGELGGSNSCQLVIPQLYVHSKMANYVVPVGWTLGDHAEHLALIDASMIDEQTSRLNDVAELKFSVSSETKARVYADGVHTQAIADETNARLMGDSLLQLRLDQEVFDRKSAIISASNTSASNAQAVEDEKTRAMLAESVLRSSISANEVRADTAQVAVDGSIAYEASQRTDADSVLRATALAFRETYDAYVIANDARVNFIVSNTNPASLDSLTEIVQKFNSDGADFSSRLTSIETILQELLNR